MKGVIGRIIESAEEGIIALLLVSMTLLVFVEVILRFGFNTGFLWMQELTLHLSAWMVLFGVSWGVKVGAHIGVDALVRVVPDAAKRVMGIVAVALCITYCGIFLYGGWVYLAKLFKVGIEMEDLPVPRWLSESILLIGLALLMFRFLQVLWKLITGEMTSLIMHDEAQEALKDLEGGALETKDEVGGTGDPRL